MHHTILHALTQDLREKSDALKTSLLFNLFDAELNGKHFESLKDYSLLHNKFQVHYYPYQGGGYIFLAKAPYPIAEEGCKQELVFYSQIPEHARTAILRHIPPSLKKPEEKKLYVCSLYMIKKCYTKL